MDLEIGKAKQVCFRIIVLYVTRNKDLLSNRAYRLLNLEIRKVCCHIGSKRGSGCVCCLIGQTGLRCWALLGKSLRQFVMKCIIEIIGVF
jgi:hypothetical protein